MEMANSSKFIADSSIADVAVRFARSTAGVTVRLQTVVKLACFQWYYRSMEENNRT